MAHALLAASSPAASPPPLRLVHTAEPPAFGELERLAILIGERDPLPRTGAGRWFRALLDAHTPRPLADPRLEALRRLVLALRRGGTAEATDAATRAGLPQGQVDALAVRYGVR